MDVSPEDDRIKRRIIGCTVSILVLVDVSPEVILMVHLSTNSVVSILVLVDVSPEAGLRRSAGTRVPVSILVLVDVSPEVPTHQMIVIIFRGFNPCSRGCFARSYEGIRERPLDIGFNPCSRGCFARSSRTLIAEEAVPCFNPCSRGCFARSLLPPLPLLSRQVSILVLVDVSPEESSPSFSAARGQVSILVLVDVSPEGCYCILLSLFITVSILVLVDVSPEAATLVYIRFSVQFQSLFSWMFRPKNNHKITRLDPGFVSILVLVDVSPEVVRHPRRKNVVPCFNPCSRGCFARRTPLLHPERRRLVSILVLVDVSPEDVIKRQIRFPQEFQSLFSWMFRPKMFCPIIIFMIDSFNPCSRGCFARSGTGPAHAPKPKVSILVLVDVSPEDRDLGRTVAIHGFQSLFSWMFRPKKKKMPGLCKHRGFNPCSRGCFARSQGIQTAAAGDSCFNPCSRGCFARSRKAFAPQGFGTGFNPCSRGCFARRPP